jgi:hypothetical protein
MKLTLVSVNRLLELVDSGGHLESLQKDSLLTLDADILGPSDEPGEISLGLDVSSDSEVSGVLFE